jgi:hypothetical protein
MEWKEPIRIGSEGYCSTWINSVEKKGFDRGMPMVFVRQHIEIRDRPESSTPPNVVEERTHVYLALGTTTTRATRVGKLTLHLIKALDL